MLYVVQVHIFPIPNKKKREGVNDEGYYLSEVYSSYSQAKQNAWEYCLNLCNKENGHNFHIISHNTFGFSVAWYVSEGVRIETPKNSYLVTC